MTGFLIFVGVVAIVILALRYWRRREIEAFLETDMSVFEDLTAIGDQASSVQLQARLQAIAEGDVNTPPGRTADADPAPRYHLKDPVFDDVHRGCLETLEKIVGNVYRLHVHVPLQDLVRAESDEHRQRLKGQTLSFLLCDKTGLSPICGIQLKGAGQSEVDRHALIEDVFHHIEKPLITLPVATAYSAAELKELLGGVLHGSTLVRLCPRCGKEMMMRKAVKGRNAGKSFWVCKEFPSCKGIMRIGRF